MIFLSHSSEDEGYARALFEQLRDLGVEVWFSPERIKLGDSFPEEMSRALESGGLLMLVAWSRHAASSPHVKTEVNAFYTRRPEAGPLLFVRLDDTPVKALYDDRTNFRATGDARRDALKVKTWADEQNGREAGRSPARPRHPLHDFARGPLVDFYRVTDDLVRGYANLLVGEEAALAAFHRAVRLRREADPGDPHLTVVELIDLPAFGRVGPYAFWQAAFHQACLHGPRMVAALLHSLPERQLPPPAHRDRAALLDHLRATNHADADTPSPSPGGED